MPRTDKRQRLRMDPTVRRAMIIDAATEMFAEQGYDTVSVAQIAERVQGSEALVYRYFPSKSALYTEALQIAFSETFETIENNLANIAPDLPWYAAAKEISNASMDYFSTDRQLQTKLLSAVREPAAAGQIRENWVNYGMTIADRILPEEFSRVPVMVESCIAGWARTVFAWVRDGHPADQREIINAALVETMLGIQRALHEADK